MSDQANPTPTPEPGQQQGRGILQKLLVAAVVLISAGIGMAGTLLLLYRDALYPDAGDSRDGDVRACIIDPSSRDFTGAAGKQQKGTPEPGCPPKDATVADGLVERTSGSSLTLRTMQDGKLGKTVKLHVREPDRPYIDIAHAQTHAALGQPVRVYTKRIDGRESVIYLEDAPLLG